MRDLYEFCVRSGLMGDCPLRGEALRRAVCAAFEAAVRAARTTDEVRTLGYVACDILSDSRYTVTGKILICDPVMNDRSSVEENGRWLNRHDEGCNRTHFVACGMVNTNNAHVSWLRRDHFSPEFVAAWEAARDSLPNAGIHAIIHELAEALARTPALAAN